MIFVMYECEERLGYTFKDKTLLRTCFTHSSYSHEHGGKTTNFSSFSAMLFWNSSSRNIFSQSSCGKRRRSHRLSPADSFEETSCGGDSQARSERIHTFRRGRAEKSARTPRSRLRKSFRGSRCRDLYRRRAGRSEKLHKAGFVVAVQTG